MFLALSLSITAFPVLARILADRGLTDGDLGRLALGCAAVDDVAAWCLLALVTGLPRHDALALGALMNTRGLVELIALNVGLQLGLISPTLFAMLVLMALATTLATAPILGRLGLGVAVPAVSTT